MLELFGQLNIDFRLLLSQGTNFFIVLAALTFFVYKPLVKNLNERKAKIEFGLRGAREAEERLAGIEALKKQKIIEAEKNAFEIVRAAEAVALRPEAIDDALIDEATEALKGEKI